MRIMDGGVIDDDGAANDDDDDDGRRCTTNDDVRRTTEIIAQWTSPGTGDSINKRPSIVDVKHVIRMCLGLFVLQLF